MAEVYIGEIASGDTFFCHACLEDCPKENQSDDPRYCEECCIFLLNEHNSGSERWAIPNWVPLISPNPPKTHRTHHNENLSRRNSSDNPVEGAGTGGGKKEKQPALL